MLDESFADKLKNGAITVAAVLTFMQAHSQEPEKVGKVLDTVATQGSEELRRGVEAATGIDFGDRTADFFEFSPDKPEVKKEPRQMEKLNLGSYAHAAHVTKSNHTENGNIKYFVEIPEKRYVNSRRIYNSIKDANAEAKGIEIIFTHKNTPLLGKEIKL